MVLNQNYPLMIGVEFLTAFRPKTQFEGCLMDRTHSEWKEYYRVLMPIHSLHV